MSQEAHLLSSCSLSHGHTDSQDGVRSKIRLVLRPVELVNEGINPGLVFHIEPLLYESWPNSLVDILDSLKHAFASPLAFVAVSQLTGLVDPCAGS